MAVPKRRTSASKRDKRRAHDALQRAARDRLPAVWRADAAPSGLPALRHLPRPYSGRGRGRLTLPPPRRLSVPRPGLAAGRHGARSGRRVSRGRGAPSRRPTSASACALSTLCFEGPAETLAAHRARAAGDPCRQRRGVPCRSRSRAASTRSLVAGHSLGEWSALVAAGALGVRRRGPRCARARPPDAGRGAAGCGGHGGGDRSRGGGRGRRCATRRPKARSSAPANLNGAGQVVVAGHAGSRRACHALAAARGARTARLDVSAPFHCALMAPAADGVAALPRRRRRCASHASRS